MSRRIAGWAPLVAILALALAVRVWAYVGPSFGWGADEARFIAVAQNMANGHFPHGESEWFGTRLVLLAPVAASFRLFGAGDLSAMLWPLFGSLLAVAAAYLLGRELVGARVGVIAASLVALAPLEARLGTVLRPDAIMPGLVGMSVWCALRARRGHPAWAVGAGVALGAGWSVRENALLMAPVVVVALWPAMRRAALPALAGAATIPVLASIVFLAGDGRPWAPLVGAGTEGRFRNPVAAWSIDGSYSAQAVRGAVDPHDLLFLAVPVIIGAAAVVVARRERRAVLPGLWLAWAALYLEFGTLINLTKPSRYLTLCTIPAALLVALAVDGRLALLAPAAAAVAAITVLWTLPGRELRGDDVFLLARVADRLRELPAGPVATASYTWHAKLATYLARDRLTVPPATDPAFASPEAARAARLMRPLPDPIDAARGYVVTGPVHPRAAWPANWNEYRSQLERSIPGTGRLVRVADVGVATIWRWRR